MRRLRTCRLIPYLFGGRLLCDGFPLIFSGNAGNPLHTVELPQYADKGIHRHLQPVGTRRYRYRSDVARRDILIDRQDVGSRIRKRGQHR